MLLSSFLFLRELFMSERKSSPPFFFYCFLFGRGGLIIDTPAACGITPSQSTRQVESLLNQV